MFFKHFRQTGGVALGAVAMISLGLASPGARAGVVTLQQGVDSYSGTADATLFQSSPNDNYGDYIVDRVRNYKDFADGRGEDQLIRFDLSGVSQSGSALQSATLTLTKYGDGDSHFDPEGSTDVPLRRVLRPWSEGSVTYNDTGVSSTAWTIGGARGNGSDRAAMPTDTISVDTHNGSNSGDDATTNGPYSWDVTCDVRAFLNGTEDNHGWQLENEQSGYTVYFRSADYSDAGSPGDRPMLTMNFSSVPEPASLSLLGIGGMLMMVRRRRANAQA